LKCSDWLLVRKMLSTFIRVQEQSNCNHSKLEEISQAPNPRGQCTNGVFSKFQSDIFNSMGSSGQQHCRGRLRFFLAFWRYGNGQNSADSLVIWQKGWIQSLAALSIYDFDLGQYIFCCSASRSTVNWKPLATGDLQNASAFEESTYYLRSPSQWWVA
jgi:hypothetical protein